MGSVAERSLSVALLVLVAIFTFAQAVQASHQVEHIGDHPAEFCEICVIGTSSDDLAGVEGFELVFVSQRRVAARVSRFSSHASRYLSNRPRGPPSTVLSA